MSTLKLIVAIGFAVAFGAGLVTGIGVQRKAVTSTPPPPQTPQPNPTTGPGRPRGTPLDQLLNLTQEQKEQARKIWEPVWHFGPMQDEKRRAEARKERDQAIAGLIVSENKAAYDKVLADYSARLQQIDQERRAAWEKAREQFRNMLTGEQRAKYDEIMSRRHEMDHGGRGRDRATSRPATQHKAD